MESRKDSEKIVREAASQQASSFFDSSPHLFTEAHVVEGYNSEPIL